MKYLVEGTDEVKFLTDCRNWQTRAREAVRVIGDAQQLPPERRTLSQLQTRLARYANDDQRLSLLRDVVEAQCVALVMAQHAIDRVAPDELDRYLPLPEARDTFDSLSHVIDLILFLMEAPGASRPTWYALSRTSDDSQPSVN
jgi:hypothetical protein